MKNSKHLLSVAAACLVGYAAGNLSLDRAANADVRRSAPRAAFQAGSERSLATLDEIAKHLKSIDARVARIEQAVRPEGQNKRSPQR